MTSWWDSIEWNPNRSLYWATAAGAALAIVHQLVLRAALGSAGSFHEYPLLLSLTLYILSVVIVQAAIEEIYFRGILFLAIRQKLGGLVAIAVTTVAFAFLHPGHRLNVLPVAIALGVTRLKTRSVASCSYFTLHDYTHKCRCSNAIATAKFPEIVGCARTTLPRALKRGRCETPIANSTVEPSWIRKALERRMPPRLIFSE